MAVAQCSKPRSIRSILSDIVLPENVWFGFLRFGQECNAAGSHSFSDALCCIENITYRNQSIIYTKNFCKVFERGIEVISNVKSGDKEKLRKLTPHDSDALQILHDYFLEKGHDEVWHGFVDIIVGSHEGIVPESSIATTPNIDTATCTSDEELGTPSKKMKYEEDEPSLDSPGGKSIDEVQLSTSGAEDQAVAETVVFSFIQRAWNPQLKNHLIPNIVIDSRHFRILMYDSENDYLLCSMLLPIFEEDGYSLSLTSILVLWMVLHYRNFCSGIENPESLCEVRSNFREIVGEKLSIYSAALKVCEAKFNVSGKSTFPSNDMFIYIKPL
ncbi:hypothetical protein FSP39_012522 [Pinctada imbricata]|uniref:Uncharacterized protein n=1 Tax=Pinctada imbricata TaxID=66713 RepID=A0AA88Y3I2_PINIB|nr:hypothetical protein FSP39_012522 [Pinctada imbricata]